MGLSTQAAAAVEAYSLEMTAADIDALRGAASSIPIGTAINITFLPTEDTSMRIAAARAVRELGFVPVVHISARRLGSELVLDKFLAELEADSASQNVFVVAGDTKKAEGVFEDALAVIRSPLLRRRGVDRVSIAGYPEGHPEISEAALWSALVEKVQVLSDQGLAGDIITQFGFDAEAVIAWVREVREHGVDLPIRIGVPGPVGVRRLLAYAKRCGVRTSSSIAKKYGLSVTNLLSTVGPDGFLEAFTAAYDPTLHGRVALHFYTFGGLQPTADWISAFLAAPSDHSPSVR